MTFVCVCICISIFMLFKCIACIDNIEEDPIYENFGICIQLIVEAIQIHGYRFFWTFSIICHFSLGEYF